MSTLNCRFRRQVIGQVLEKDDFTLAAVRKKPWQTTDGKRSERKRTKARNGVRVGHLNDRFVLDELKQQYYWVAGLEESPDAVEPETRMLQGSLVVVVGSEGAGISRLTREKCDFLVRLPMYGRIDSLNAAIAGSIMLYLVRQANKVEK